MENASKSRHSPLNGRINSQSLDTKNSTDGTRSRMFPTEHLVISCHGNHHYMQKPIRIRGSKPQFVQSGRERHHGAMQHRRGQHGRPTTRKDYRHQVVECRA